jgi:predicted naringenin-chalcone synthase
MILTAISDRLGLSPLHTQSAWTVLRKYGNMSSATLIFVLREMLQQYAEGESTEGKLPAGCSPFIPSLAFGPGLNVEGALLKYVGGRVGTGNEHADEQQE